MKKIGIADTTFARYDMGGAAIDELKKNSSGIKMLHLRHSFNSRAIFLNLIYY